MSWPLALHLGQDIPKDIGDPLYQTWQLAWIGHALLHQPLHLFQSNTYWPNKDSLAFSDAPIGYSLAALFAAQGVHAAVIVHNVLYIFAYALAFYGAYLLAREIGAGMWGAAAAGAAFAYAPWKLEQNSHLHVLSSGGIPLALYLLLRGYKRSSRGTILAGWVVSAWQMTLGFNLGLQFAYLLLVLGAITVIFWLRQGRPRPVRPVLQGTVAGFAIFAVVTALMAQPYIRVQHDYPEGKWKPREVAFYSPPAVAFLATSSSDYLWGHPTTQWRKTLRSATEQTLFPGLTTLLLALIGLASAVYSRRFRIGLAAGTVTCGILSLGLPYPHARRGLSLYRLLYDYAPGWDGVRTPGRINNLTSLGLALLAGAGLALVARHAQRLSARSVVPTAVCAAIVAMILFEGYGALRLPHVPSVPVGQRRVPAPQLNLPVNFRGEDSLYAFWSIDGFPNIANGGGAFNPATTTAIFSVSGFPDSASVALLRRFGIKSVILHRHLARGTPWQGAARRPIAGLGITRKVKGDLVIYRLS